MSLKENTEKLLLDDVTLTSEDMAELLSFSEDQDPEYTDSLIGEDEDNFEEIEKKICRSVQEYSVVTLYRDKQQKQQNHENNKIHNFGA